MARDKNDPGSTEMFPGTKRGRGRPPVENKLTPAERAARYRAKKKLEAQEQVDQLAREVRRLKRKLREANKSDAPKRRKT